MHHKLLLVTMLAATLACVSTGQYLPTDRPLSRTPSIRQLAAQPPSIPSTDGTMVPTPGLNPDLKTPPDERTWNDDILKAPPEWIIAAYEIASIMVAVLTMAPIGDIIIPAPLS